MQEQHYTMQEQHYTMQEQQPRQIAVQAISAPQNVHQFGASIAFCVHTMCRNSLRTSQAHEGGHVAADYVAPK